MEKLSCLSGNDCITIIGMAGCGKTTVGRELAERLGWAHVDTDYLIESAYGAHLQEISDALGKEAFIEVEKRVILSVRMQRAVLSTGGSVIYRDESMLYLQKLGPIVYLNVALPVILERIARVPDRGLAIAPGQTVEDLFRERETLYNKWADCVVTVQDMTPSRCAERILEEITLSAKWKQRVRG